MLDPAVQVMVYHAGCGGSRCRRRRVVLDAAQLPLELVIRHVQLLEALDVAVLQIQAYVVPPQRAVIPHPDVVELGLAVAVELLLAARSQFVVDDGLGLFLHDTNQQKYIGTHGDSC